MDCAAFPASIILRLVKVGRLREPEAVIATWAAHGVHDSYLPLSAIRRVYDRVLPGAAVRRHLLWRYSIAWKKQ